MTRRASDELTLKMVRLRAEGKSPAKIAAMIGRPPQFVSTATTRVLRADLEESGEPAGRVMARYWADGRNIEKSLKTQKGPQNEPST